MPPLFHTSLFLLSALRNPLVSGWDANWDSLDSRPLPTWYDEAKFGIFLHWGVFSVPSFGSEWFWRSLQDTKDYQDYVHQTERVKFAYSEYAHRFDATLFRPDEWARIFADSGAQYVVLTSKHHEGFCNWDSRDVPTTWNWNAVDVGPRRDILGDLAKQVKRTTSPHTQRALKFGVYHSLFEWYNPAYRRDQQSNFTSSTFVDTKTLPELYDLVEKYQPELIWSDGDWEATSSYWKSVEFLAWYATHSAVNETALWNDRWGQDSTCHHGSFLTCQDRYQPNKLQSRKWEDAMTIDKTSWGFNRNASFSDYLTTEQLIHQLIETVAYNGNLLLNVGPSADGTISPIFVDRLQSIGDWLRVNGVAIYATQPWAVCPNETSANVFYTINPKTNALYAIVTKWPAGGSRLALTCPIPMQGATSVQLLGYAGEVEWGSISGTGMQITMPALTPDIIPCQYAWVLAMTDIQNVLLDDETTRGPEIPSSLPARSASYL